MDRFKFRIWWKKENRYRVDTHIIQIGRLTDFANSDEYVIEQCTGLKDKNSNLIYENDIVLGASGFKYCIIWSEMEVGWALQNLESKVCIAMNVFTADEIEIIGTIHEQKDVK